MKILVLNGSPKGSRSNTLRLTEAFLQGLSETGDHIIEAVTIRDSQIEPCLGCFSCWTKSPGQCVIKDDMAEFIGKYLEADLVIWSLPLYYFGMPSKIKAFMDRLLPTNLPFMADYRDGERIYGHPPRYDMTGKRYILISTCGFAYKENNYEALIKQFDILYGDELTCILCPEGELFAVPQLEGRMEEYLEAVRRAGREYCADGDFTEATRAELNELLYPVEAFVEMADASWEIAGEPLVEKDGNPQSKAYNFMRQMRATFNARAAQGVHAVVEMDFTDIEEIYQLEIGENHCNLLVGATKTPTTRITTTYGNWLAISSGELDGTVAMMEGKYRVHGDFSIMLKMNDLFGGSRKAQKTAVIANDKKANMALFLLPWILLWIIGPFNLMAGVAAAMLTACLIAAFARTRWELTTYELTNPLVISGLFTLTVFSSLEPKLIVASSYPVFGGIWLLSGFAKIPLTAWYSQYGYGGDALSNALFIRTNRILTRVWGLFYLLTFLWTYRLIDTGYFAVSGGINTMVPMLLGVFTKWFADWYPAKVARGEI